MIPTLPDEVLERLEDEIVTLAGHINAAEYRFLKLLADYDQQAIEAAVDEHGGSAADAIETESSVSAGTRVSAETSAATLVSMRRAAATDVTVTEKPDASVARRGRYNKGTVTLIQPEPGCCSCAAAN